MLAFCIQRLLDGLALFCRQIIGLVFVVDSAALLLITPTCGGITIEGVQRHHHRIGGISACDDRVVGIVDDLVDQGFEVISCLREIHHAHDVGLFLSCTI